MHGSLEYPASGEAQDRPGSVLVQHSGHVDYEVQISALDVFFETDGRKTRCNKEVLDLVSRRRCLRYQVK